MENVSEVKTVLLQVFIFYVVRFNEATCRHVLYRVDSLIRLTNFNAPVPHHQKYTAQHFQRITALIFNLTFLLLQTDSGCFVFEIDARIQN